MLCWFNFKKGNYFLILGNSWFELVFVCYGQCNLQFLEF